VRRISYGQTSLTIGLFAIILVFVANGWVISSNVVALRDQQRWVSHTHEVIGTLEDILTKVTGAETASRGYLISHDRRFLDSFNSELKTSMENLVSVKALTADNPTQQESVRELDVLLRGREKAMQSTVENFERSRKVPLEDFQAGHEAMVALRRHVDIMENVERKLLSQRELAASEAYRFVQYTLSGVTAVMLLFAGLIYGLLRRHLFLQAAAAAAQARESRLRTAEADCATLVGGDKPIATIADQLVELVAQAIGAPGVNFFLVEGGSITFEAGYARSGASSQHRARSGELTYQLGDGLIGSAATRTEITQISQVPQDYFKLASSFGESTPAHLIFVPIRFQNHTVGLLEAALFRELQLEQIEWLQAAAHALGVGLNAAISRQRQQGLIEEMQRQSEELQSQQEELRTSNEELEEQAHELTQSQERLQVQQEELQQINQELEQQKAALESQSDALDERNRALEDAKAETERKAHELERTNLYKSEFLAKMSHELRTPLNSLMILSTLLHENRSGNLSAQQVEFAQTIFEAGGDLLTLINDILDLSKLEARKLMARPEPFTIAPFFDQMVAIFKPMLAAKNLDLLIEIGTDAPTELVTDRQRLQQIIRNLLSNAVKFTDSGSITLSAHAGTQPGLLKISVRDTGIGIPEEKKQLIFEAFEQADGSVSRRYGGTGLGLTISRELAYLLGGTITVQSNTSTGGGGGGGSEVGGSCFTIELPAVLKLDQDSNHVSSAPTLTGTRPPVAQKTSIALASAEAPAGAATSTASAHQIESPRPSSYAPFINRVQVETMQAAIAALPADAKTILIVEDDVTFRAAVADAARVSGFTPFEIENGETALEILRNHVPKAILLDIGLPGISGLAVLEQI
jgi:signal transduction histidine kinase/CHASE3 domain sensor protein